MTNKNENRSHRNKSSTECSMPGVTESSKSMIALSCTVETILHQFNSIRVNRLTDAFVLEKHKSRNSANGALKYITPRWHLHSVICFLKVSMFVD
jgi:hypothetical protein